MPVAPLVFVHIPKAAGTSLKDRIAKTYSGRPMLFFTPGDGRLDAFAALPPARRASCAVVAGHEPFGLQRVYNDTGVEPAVITVLREPVSRVVSLYRYIFAEPDHFRHADFNARRPTIAQILGERDFIPFDNHQTRYLAGRPTIDKPFGTLDRSDLDAATHNLEHACAAFWLQHRMDESLRLFASVLDWPETDLPTLNTAREQVDAPEITDADRRAIADANGLDGELVTFAESLLDQRLADAGLA